MADGTPSILEPEAQEAITKTLQYLQEVKREEANKKFKKANDQGRVRGGPEPRLQVPQDPEIVVRARRKLLQYTQSLQRKALAGDEDALKALGYLTTKEEVKKEDQWESLTIKEEVKEEPASQPASSSAGPAQGGPTPSRFPYRLRTGHVIDIRSRDALA